MVLNQPTLIRQIVPNKIKLEKKELAERASQVSLLLLDVDGVLTDGRLYFGPSGETLKAFFVRDGYGLKLWHQAGFRSGIISGRDSDIVSLRGRELGIKFIKQGCEEKHIALEEIISEAGVPTGQCAFIGDDTLDIEVFDRVGLSVAVADAHEDVRRAADYITKAAGGRGAVREVIDILLATRSS
jgi:3-deoxy-D-manno-octulosonate 8-phosphate phosphatase (KDO 8-P phosphatase)